MHKRKVSTSQHKLLTKKEFKHVNILQKISFSHQLDSKIHLVDEAENIISPDNSFIDCNLTSSILHSLSVELLHLSGTMTLPSVLPFPVYCSIF